MTTRRILAILLAFVVALGASILPATAATAAGTKTGTIRVQLLTIDGADWRAKDFVVTASGMTRDVYKEDATDASGVAVLRVPPGKYTITVATYRTRYEYAVVSQDYIAIQRGQTKTIGMTMYKGGVITGKLVKPSGFALADATVAAVNRKGVPMAMTQTTKKGRYRLAGLPTGAYAIVFNYRSWDDNSNDAINDYGWSYYKGKSLASAKFVRAYQQNKFAAATKTTKINGIAPNATDLSVTLTEKNSKEGRLLVDHLSGKGKYLESGSVYAPFVAGRSATVTLMPGKYRLGVVYAGVNYYYTGDGQTLTKTLSAATLTYFGGGPLSVTFGPIP